MILSHNTRVAFVFGMLFLLLGAYLYSIEKAAAMVLFGVGILTPFFSSL